MQSQAVILALQKLCDPKNIPDTLVALRHDRLVWQFLQGCDFDKYAQWLLDGQLQEVQAEARRQNLSLGLYLDLAVGINPGDGPGYFNEKGANWQRQMLMAPLEYARVTSGFSLRRLHPIFKKVMPHYGVDYAAPVGTPVRAAGSGTVATAGHSGGAGRYVVLKHHHGGIETSYLHLSRFAEELVVEAEHRGAVGGAEVPLAGLRLGPVRS